MDSEETGSDDLIEYLIANLRDLIRDHGHPTDKLLRGIVSEFIKSVTWDKETMDKIVYVWGKYPPPDTHGVIGMFQSLFRTIAHGKMDFAITPRYIQLFVDAPTLRIPRTLLSARSNRFLSLLEHEDAWSYFFRSAIEKEYEFDADDCKEFRGFLFNDEIESCMDRIEVIWLIVIKTMLVMLSTDDGIYLIDCVLCIMAALQNVLVRKPVIRDGRIEVKRKWDSVDDGLSDVLAIIGKPSFYSTLFGVWADKRSRS